MPLVRIAPAGGAGVVRDISSHELAPNAWTDARNVRFLDGSAWQLERTRDVEGNNAALAVLTATVGGIDKRLAEVALDVKNLLTGRVRPAGRRDQET